MASDSSAPPGEEVWRSVRAEFPALAHWTYLNTATLGLLSRRTSAAVVTHLERRDLLANTDFDQWWEDVDGIRALVSSLLHGSQREDIAFLPNASTALSLARRAIPWEAGDEILTLREEFPNQTYAAAGLPGVRLVQTSVDEFWNAVSPRTRMVALSTVSYQTGFRPPWEEWMQPLRRRGILTYIDATQSFGAFVTSIAGCEPTVLAVNAYKWCCAPTGAAFAYIHPELRARFDSPVVGWRSDRGWRNMRNLKETDPKPTESAERYEGGMLAFPSLYGLRAALEMFRDIGPTHIEARIRSLAKRCGGDGTSPIVSLQVRDGEAPTLAETLKRDGILVSARRGRLRISPHFFNDESDVARLWNALERARA